MGNCCTTDVDPKYTFDDNVVGTVP